MRYTIYKIINTINSMIYIGSTTKTVKQRLATHKSQAKSTATDQVILNAIREIGAEHFFIDEIKETEDKKEEYNLIEKFRSWHPEIGYNRERRLGIWQSRHYILKSQYKNTVCGVCRKLVPFDQLIGYISGIKLAYHIACESQLPTDSKELRSLKEGTGWKSLDLEYENEPYDLLV